jgi:uncharacterized membrane protein (DUF4010 family)
MENGVQNVPIATIIDLLIALGIGLLIGLERGWKGRGDPDGTRVAGLRTIGLIGFLGGLLAHLDPGQGFVIAAGLVGLALLLEEGFQGQIDVTREVSVTTMVAALSAYGLGALSGIGQSQLAAGGAVLVAFVLLHRGPLHELVHAIEGQELSAFLRWLMISVVILPLLPDEQMGPFLAFNPRTFWLIVVIISGLGFLGYLGIKWLGPRNGIALTAIMGGLVSSTAVTLSFAQLGRSPTHPDRMLQGGVAIAWALMIVRTFLIVFVLAPAVLVSLWAPLGAMFAVAAGRGGLLLRNSNAPDAMNLDLSNPLDLKAAVMFAVLLAGAMLLSKAAAEQFGPAGLYFVSAISGAVDVDAISLSVSQLAANGLAAPQAGAAIYFAVIANTLLKGGISVFSGGWAYGRGCVLLALAMAAAGAMVAVLV